MVLASNTVAFPRFPFIYDKVFEINSVAFSAFGYEIKWYGVILAFAFLIAALYCFSRTKEFNTNVDQFVDVLLWALPMSIIGARLYFVLNSWDYYKQNPGDIFKTWEGGLAIYGAILFAFLTVFIYCRIKKLDLLSMLDLGSIGLLIGQGIGRWANFINAEVFGVKTNAVWGMSVNGASPVHPAFLYEFVWNFLGVIGLHFYSKHRRFKGEITLLYIAWYGLGRGLIEGIRDPKYILYIANTDLAVSQVLAYASLAIALCILLYLYFSKQYAPLNRPVPVVEDDLEIAEPQGVSEQDEAPVEPDVQEGDAPSSDPRPDALPRQDEAQEDSPTGDDIENAQNADH